MTLYVSGLRAPSTATAGPAGGVAGYLSADSSRELALAVSHLELNTRTWLPATDTSPERYALTTAQAAAALALGAIDITTPEDGEDR